MSDLSELTERQDRLSAVESQLADLAREHQWALAELSAREWQDISTAPKDGTEVLGYWIKSKVMSVVIYLPQCRVWLDNEGEVSAPTHWMPLPAPPASLDMREGGR